MAIWQFDALVHASYTAKLPGPVPQGELTLNAIEHFPWAVVSHAIAEAAVGCAVGDPVRSAWNTFGSPAGLSLYTVGYKHVANRAQRLMPLPL